MNKLALAAVATIAVGAALTSAADAKLAANGPGLTGMALPSPESGRSTITAVTLPSGETIELNQSANR